MLTTTGQIKTFISTSSDFPRIEGQTSSAFVNAWLEKVVRPHAGQRVYEIANKILDRFPQGTDYEVIVDGRQSTLDGLKAIRKTARVLYLNQILTFAASEVVQALGAAIMGRARVPSYLYEFAGEMNAAKLVSHIRIFYYHDGRTKEIGRGDSIKDFSPGDTIWVVVDDVATSYMNTTGKGPVARAKGASGGGGGFMGIAAKAVRQKFRLATGKTAITRGGTITIGAMRMRSLRQKIALPGNEKMLSMYNRQSRIMAALGKDPRDWGEWCIRIAYRKSRG